MNEFKTDGFGAVCKLCPRLCYIEEGNRGFCGARTVVQGSVVLAEYGKLSGLALDPIEKKPFQHFYPGENILSLGFFGCNMLCPYCQNHEISHPASQDRPRPVRKMTPEQIVDLAKSLLPQGNIGVAYTYNEPLTSFEFVLETAMQVHEAGLKNVVVSNGCFEGWAIEALMPYVDAWNIDLKSFREDMYRQLGGDLGTVLCSIQRASGQNHVEVTALIVPGQNDSEAEMDEMSRWLASVNPEIPLHISRSFPHWLRSDLVPPPVSQLVRLVKIAKQHLRYVYGGNFSMP
jgi:pyruvate formate lyase activating enzyme